MHSRDQEVGKFLVEASRKYGYPERFRATYGKNTDDRIFEVASMLAKAGLDKGVSLTHQSLSREVQNNIKRWNIKLGTYERLQARFNEAGIALQALWDPADDPQVAFENPSLPRQGGYTPHPVRIEQLDDHVVISYEEYGGVRTIYFDGRDAGSVGDSLVKLGRSTARYEDGKLIIESTHIPAGPTGQYGNQLSDQTTTVETYRRLDDPTQGPMVEMEMIINDPGNLAEPWEMVWKKLYTPNYEFIAVECHAPY